MRYILVTALMAICATIRALGAATGLDAKIDTVKRYLAGRAPLAELDSANVYLITRADIDYEQYEAIFSGYLIPFALSHRDEIPDADLAWLYRNHAVIYSMLEQPERQIAAIDSAVELIDGTDDEPQARAAIYANAGDAQISHGSIERGHELFFKAISIYEEMGGCDMEISNCLYQLAVGYLQILDYAGLEYVMGQMQELCAKPGVDPNCLYDLYSVKTALYAVMHDKDPGNKSLSDSTLLYSHKAIDIIEGHPGKLRARVVPSWNYYNHARSLFRAPDVAERYDSVAAYLDKALKAVPQEESVSREVHISVYLLQGEMLYRQGLYARAEECADKARELLGMDAASNSLVVEWEHLWRLYADVCEATGRYRNALEYRKQAEEVMAKRFDGEKAEALKRLEVKYEVEKKEAAIASLQEQSRAARRIAWLLGIVAVVLAAIIALVAVVARMRRRNVEQRLYEAALLAELRQEELDRTRAEMEQRQAKGRNGIFAAVIGKMLSIISASSAIDGKQKEEYTAQLRQLDDTRLDADFSEISPQMTQMDLKYAICFYIGMEVRDIAAIFNVEPASVYTVRYRMRKKYGGAVAMRFMM